MSKHKEKEITTDDTNNTTADIFCNKKHLKNVGPIHHCEPPHAVCFTLPFTRCRYCRMPPLSHAACASMSTTTTTTTRDRGDCYGPIEWAQLHCTYPDFVVASFWCVGQLLVHLSSQVYATDEFQLLSYISRSQSVIQVT